MSSSDEPDPLPAPHRGPDRRAALALLGVGALFGCGFRPLHGAGGGAAGLRGAVILAEATDPETYAFRERLRRRFGDAGAGAAYRLDYELRMEETGVAITGASDITRHQVAGVARWRLSPLEAGAAPLEGQVRAAGAYDAGSAPFATLSAQRSERRQMATELAERTATRIFAAFSKDG